MNLFTIMRRWFVGDDRVDAHQSKLSLIRKDRAHYESRLIVIEQLLFVAQEIAKQSPGLGVGLISDARRWRGNVLELVNLLDRREQLELRLLHFHLSTWRWRVYAQSVLMAIFLAVGTAVGWRVGTSYYYDSIQELMVVVWPKLAMVALSYMVVSGLVSVAMNWPTYRLRYEIRQIVKRAAQIIQQT